MSECRGEHCTQEIVWAVRRDGRQRHPFTVPEKCPGPGRRCTHEGTFAVWWSGGKTYYRPLRSGEHLTDVEHRAVSHYATCVDAESFRCPVCNHKPHGDRPCQRAGPVSCKKVGTAIVRAAWPCGCTHGVPIA